MNAPSDEEMASPSMAMGWGPEVREGETWKAEAEEMSEFVTRGRE